MTKTKSLRAKYNEEVKAAMKEKFGYENDLMIPKLHKIVLNMGVGEANLNVNLLGTSNIKSGIGETDLTIIGSKTDYKLDVKKGIGSITVDGKDISNFTSNEEAQNTVKIEGGIGSVKISFQK